MANFATGLNAGVNTASKWVDMYNQGAQRRAIKGINAQTPEVSQGFTAAQGEELKALSEAKDPNGVPYYLVQTNDAAMTCNPTRRRRVSTARTSKAP